MVNARRLLGLLFALFVSLGAPSISGGDAQSEVTGTITNFLGQRIPGINVMFSSRGQELLVKTTESGRYSIKLAPGLYTVVVQQGSDFCGMRRSNFILERHQRLYIDFELFLCGIIDMAEQFDEKGLPVRVNMEEVYRKHVGYDYEELPALDIPNLKPLVEFGGRREHGAVEYTGLIQQGHYVRPVLTYNAWTLRANSIKYDRTTQTVSAEGDLIWQDGKTTQTGKSMKILFRGRPQAIKIEH
ncbi:MAG: hypothetical protein NVS9B4_19510 [Candidatus Acidiferrum sp.]